jgi:hypothetical protein
MVSCVLGVRTTCGMVLTPAHVWLRTVIADLAREL